MEQVGKSPEIFAKFSVFFCVVKKVDDSNPDDFDHIGFDEVFHVRPVSEDVDITLDIVILIGHLPPDFAYLQKKVRISLRICLIDNFKDFPQLRLEFHDYFEVDFVLFALDNAFSCEILDLRLCFICCGRVLRCFSLFFV